MKIENHKLTEVPYIETPNVSGTINPTLLVLHYTASGRSAEQDAKYFSNPAAKASAHLVIGRAGDIYQCAPFNRKTWHAGKSSWRGKPNCNDYSIGIEIDNWGILTKRADGNYYSWTNEVVPPSNVIEAKNKLGSHGYWETYSLAQLKSVEKIVNMILESYPSITEIVGHEDISPRRKIDPGPALYDFIRKLNNKIGNGRGDSTEDGFENRKVNASILNVRAEPTSSSDVVGQIRKGDTVQVEYDGGLWSKITAPSGWVYDKYLT